MPEDAAFSASNGLCQPGLEFPSIMRPIKLLQEKTGRRFERHPLMEQIRYGRLTASLKSGHSACDWPV
jgi:hypothetical protein